MNKSYLVFLLPFLLTDCSSLYRYQRQKDTADVFTLQFQTHSYGAAVRTGPVKLGLQHKSRDGRSVGLRGGEVGEFDDQDFALFLLGSDMLFDVKPADTGQTTEQQPLPSTLKLRRKDVKARSPAGTTIPLHKAKPLFKQGKIKDRYAPVEHQTGIEISAGLFFGIRLGFSFAEFVDWGLGWFGIDILSDDLPFHPDEIRERLPENSSAPNARKQDSGQQ